MACGIFAAWDDPSNVRGEGPSSCYETKPFPPRAPISAFTRPAIAVAGFLVARGTVAWHTRPMRMDLSPAQIGLLERLQKGPVTFSGAEPDDDRLAMLQLYIAGLASQVSRQAIHSPIKWCIAPLGNKMLRSLRS